MSKMLSNTGPARVRSGRVAHRVRSANRTLFACVNCKEKKLKCDNKISGCENCRRSDLVCLVEDPASKRHLPRNYLETLEQRVAFLESSLRAYRPDLVTDHFFQYDPSRPVIESSPPINDPPVEDPNRGASTSPRTDDEIKENEGLDELSSKVGLLSLNAAGAEPYYLGSSSTFAFSRLINSSLRQVVLRDPDTDTQPGKKGDDVASLPTPCLLPDYDTAVKLSNAYFQNIHTQYPFLHEPTFRTWEAAIICGSVGFETLISNPMPLFFLNMVYAVGALLLPNLGCSAERLYISAQMYIDHILQHDSIESIQAILCCAVYSLRSSIGTSHWKLAGLALRQCIDLGFHRNFHRSRLNDNPLRSELRKRIFWCSYMLESQAAIMLGRPQGIPFQEVDVEYPMDIDDSCITDVGIQGTARELPSDPPTTMTGALQTFRIRRLLARIHTSLYSNKMPCCSEKPTHDTQIQDFRAEVEKWRSELPLTAPHHGEVLSLFATSEWFDLEYYYTILQLYRVQIINNQAGTVDEVFFNSLQAAENICHSYRRLFLGKPTSYTWTALHELFLAGLTYLHCLWTSPAVRDAQRQGQVSSTCTDCTIVLVIIAERWENAAPYRDIFEKLANRTIMMMDDKPSGRQELALIPGEPAPEVEGDMMEWMATLAGAGMSEGFDGLLASLVGGFGS